MLRILHKSPKLICFLLIGLLGGSCERHLTYEEFRKVDEKAWSYQQSLHFTIPLVERVPQNVSVVIRNTGEYRKANLWLFLLIESPSGKVFKDTIDCPLADDYGYWLGDGFSGLYLTKHSLASSPDFTEQGDWQVNITHGMRQDTIEGIREIGILVKKKE